MTRGMYTAATGMMTNQAVQDAIAQNLANASTIGYKQDVPQLTSFADMLLSRSSDGMNIGGVGQGARVSALATDFSDGAQQQTGNALDVALSGDAALVVQTPQGMRLSRDGSLTRSPQGQLVQVSGGGLVLGTDNRPISVPANAKQITINLHGQVSADGKEIGTLQLASLVGAHKAGDNTLTTNAVRPASATATVRQGYLEASNVSVVGAMVSMICRFAGLRNQSKDGAGRGRRHRQGGGRSGQSLTPTSCINNTAGLSTCSLWPEADDPPLPTGAAHVSAKETFSHERKHAHDARSLHGGDRHDGPATEHGRHLQQPRQRQHDRLQALAVPTFRTCMYQQMRPAGTQVAEGAQSPTGLEVGLGVKPAATETMFEQGTFQNTGNNLDVAIEGEGFFKVLLPDGTSGYSRDGSFKRDSQGKVVNSDGYAIQPEITLPADAHQHYRRQRRHGLRPPRFVTDPGTGRQDHTDALRQ